MKMDMQKIRGVLRASMLASVALIPVNVVAGASAGAAEMLSARAIVVANAQATISVFLTAQVENLPFRAGQIFKKGDVIVGFDCARYLADLRARKAVYKARAQEANNNRRLLRHQAVGASEVAVSVARMEESKALVEVQVALVQQCVVKAPYNGRVVEQLINAHETPGANQPLVRIVDSSKSELELIVPSRWLVWLKPGSEFEFHVDETGARLRAKVSRLGAVVDAVSQTIKVTGELLNEKNMVLPGMSGTASFIYSGS